jgi:hypothetical protein
MYRTGAIIICSSFEIALEKFLAFKNGVKSIQSTGYNGECMVFAIVMKLLEHEFSLWSNHFSSTEVNRPDGKRVNQNSVH